MKVLLITLLLISFLGVSALAFVTMYHDSSYRYGNCATEMATGLDCPANPFAFADFHLNLLKVFSSAPLGVFFNTYLALLAFLFFGFIFNLFGHNSLNIGKIRHTEFKRFFELQPSIFHSKSLYWFSLHENSPTA